MQEIRDFFEEQQDDFIRDYTPCNLIMLPNKMSDKYSEIIGWITDNLVFVCLYPKNPAISKWKERTKALCKRFIDTSINHVSKNRTELRLKYLNNGVYMTLDENYIAIYNHFKSTSIHYANRPESYGRLTPYKPYDEAYEENKERVKHGIISLTKFIAEQDYSKVVDYINRF